MKKFVKFEFSIYDSD